MVGQPDHDAALAEEFLSEIYRAVRNGPKWEETVLIVTFDEHGGGGFCCVGFVFGEDLTRGLGQAAFMIPFHPRSS